jgi:hypothetical protein
VTIKTKFDGIKDDVDVVGIVKAFEAFKDGLQLICDKADTVVCTLPFETTLGKKSYNFQQDESLQISGVKIDKDTKKIYYTCVFGATDKPFFNDEAELIKVTLKDDVTGEEESNDFDVHIKNEFRAAFGDLKVGSVAALQAMLRNNVGLGTILNDPSAFLEEIEKTGSRSKSYSKLEKYGRY